MVRYLRVLGWIEGSSLLLLLFVAMPLKYIWGNPSWVRGVGMAHGLLFMAFIYVLTMVGRSRGLPWRTLGIGYVCSSVPFATFWYDGKYLAPEDVPLAK